MKEWNEQQLRGWQPRRVSAKLKDRLFGPALAVSWDLSWNFSRLIPVLGCVVFTLVSFHFRSDPAWRQAAIPAGSPASVSNCAAFSDHAQEPQNHLASVTFDWTNPSIIKSSIRSQTGWPPATNFSN